MSTFLWKPCDDDCTIYLKNSTEWQTQLVRCPIYDHTVSMAETPYDLGTSGSNEEETDEVEDVIAT